METEELLSETKRHIDNDSSEKKQTAKTAES